MLKHPGFLFQDFVNYILYLIITVYVTPVGLIGIGVTCKSTAITDVGSARFWINSFIHNITGVGSRLVKIAVCNIVAVLVS